MNRHYSVYLFTLLLLLINLPAHAERSACKATYDTATGALNIDAVEFGTSRFVVKLVPITGGTTLRVKLDSSTPTAIRECYDPATISANTLTIPDLAVSDSYYAVTLTMVSGNGPTQINLATTTPSLMQFDLTSSTKNPRLVPDAGLRVEKAGIPFATVNRSTGTTYLGYISAVDGKEYFKSSTDGLTFSNPTELTYNNRSVDSRRTLMPDGKTWRLYQIDPKTGVMTSYISTDGNIFTSESGTRYTATADDKISGTPYTGVYDLYTASDGALILVYLGDLHGKNNLRMAKSTDNGVTFTFVKGNVLGDENTGYAFVDNKTVLLPDGRRRMFTMRTGQLQSFVTTDGYTWTREIGTRISYLDFASVGVTVYSLNDPVPVFDKNGNLKIYVAGATAANADTPGSTNWAVVSSTWNENVGSGVLGSNGVCGTSNGVTSTTAPATTLCTTGTASSVTGSGPWSWTCAGSNGGVAAACSATSNQTWTINTASTGSGTVSCTSPVSTGSTSTCAVTAASGYQLATFTDNGIDKKSSVTANSYSITNVTATHNIAATFSSSAGSLATVQIGAGSGTTIKPLLGENAGPLAASTKVSTELTTQYKALGVRSVRTHDHLIYSDSVPVPNSTLYPGPLDMSTMYPDFSKDPALSSSYNFTLSDQHFAAIHNGGFEPFLRIGDSAGLSKPPQPSERPNWEKAAIEVIKHYTQGQWNGYTATINEVEIWNEPDSSGFWNRSQSEFMSLYVETAVALRAAFPTLRIGGPGFTHAAVISPATGGWLYTFLDQVKAANAPLDFISFHVYSNDSNQPAAPATLLRTILDSRGFTSTKIYVTEWNTYANATADITQARAYRSGALGASTLTASWVKMQDAPVDRLFHYRGSDPNANTPEDYGLFTGAGTAKRTAKAYQLWSTLAGTQGRLTTSVTGNSNLLAIAGNDSNNKAVILVVNTANTASTWTPTDSSSQTFTGSWQLVTVSDDSSSEVTTTPTFPVPIPAYGVQLLSAVLPVNGTCGSSSEQAQSVAPTTNLCSAGTASSVTGSGPWSWSCGGSNGGTTASCSSSVQTWTVVPSVSGGNGSVTCTSPVNNGAASTCAVTAANGYQLATFTDNAIDKKTSVTVNSYTITNVTASHSITATFSLIPATSVTTTKAKIYLGADDSFTISNSGATLYGGSGSDIVTISEGVSGVTLDQNVERINFSGSSSSYAFKQTGNKINVYDSTGTTLLVNVPVQGDADGTQLSFSNGVASAKLISGVMTLGGATVNSTAGLLTPSTTNNPPSSAAATTKAKVYLGVDDSFTLNNSGTTLYGGAGTDTVTIAAGISGVTLDQNVERINFSGSSGSYTFKQTGNKINVYDGTGTTQLVNAPVQGDADGTVLSFSNGVASVLLNGGVMTLGGSTVSSVAAGIIVPILTTVL